MTSKIMLFGLLLIGLAMTLDASAVAQARQMKKKAAKPAPVKLSNVSFKKDIAPIIKSYCMPCHSENQMGPSELYLDSYEQLMQGGKHGASLIAGKADSSLMVRKMGLTPPFGDPMPAKRKTPFPKDTLAIIKAWINQGAKNN